MSNFFFLVCLKCVHLLFQQHKNWSSLKIKACFHCPSFLDHVLNNIYLFIHFNKLNFLLLCSISFFFSCIFSPFHQNYFWRVLNIKWFRFHLYVSLCPIIFLLLFPSYCDFFFWNIPVDLTCYWCLILHNCINQPQQPPPPSSPSSFLNRTNFTNDNKIFFFVRCFSHKIFL